MLTILLLLLPIQGLMLLTLLLWLYLEADNLPNIYGFISNFIRTCSHDEDLTLSTPSLDQKEIEETETYEDIDESDNSESQSDNQGQEDDDERQSVYDRRRKDAGKQPASGPVYEALFDSSGNRRSSGVLPIVASPPSASSTPTSTVINRPYTRSMARNNK